MLSFDIENSFNMVSIPRYPNFERHSPQGVITGAPWPQGQGKPKGATAESVTRTFDTGSAVSWRIRGGCNIRNLSHVSAGWWQLKYVF